jgi:glyoxylase-like metal-dependent hydrolase (beta-lactamase superfamily II)
MATGPPGPREVSPGVWKLGTHFVNWYLLAEGGRLTAIDAGLGGFAKTLDDDLARIGHDAGDIEALVLTHSDSDHTGIAPELQKRGARVLIHAADEGTLHSPRPKGGDASPRHLLANAWRPAFLRLTGHLVRNGGAKQAKVAGAETFEAGEALDVPGRLSAIHTPGHTPGHCVLLSESTGTLFVGDALCTHPWLTGGQGPSLMPRYLNADNGQALRSLDAVERTRSSVLLPGHGEPWEEGAAAAVARARANAP